MRASLAALNVLCLAAACGVGSTGPGSTERSYGDAGPAPDAAPASVDDDAATPATGGCGDTRRDPYNCGTCGRTCVVAQATAACEAGECAIGSCDDGWLDCDGDLSTGCEQADECIEGAACTTTCGTTGATSCADRCAPVCAPPDETCNAVDDDCDDECDEGLAGCRQGVHRSHGPDGHFYTLDATEAGSGGRTLERTDYFSLYAEDVAGLSPLFRCRLPNGTQLLTSSTDCEVGVAPEGTLGFMARGPRCGSVALHRLSNPANGAHFYTTSSAERDNAVATYGYVSEGVTGHVWQ